MDGGTGPVRATTVAPGGPPAPAQTIGAGASGGAVALAVNGRGNALAAWGTFRSEAQAALRPAGGAFAVPTTIADPTAGDYVAGTAIDRDARATIVLLRHGSTRCPSAASDSRSGRRWPGGTRQSGSTRARTSAMSRWPRSRRGRSVLWDTRPDYDPDRPGVARTRSPARDCRSAWWPRRSSR